jgi:hypothetical protein
LPAAKAALVALMQTTNSAAAAISIVNLMASLLAARTLHTGARGTIPGNPTGFLRTIISPKARLRCREIGPVLA